MATEKEIGTITFPANTLKVSDATIPTSVINKSQLDAVNQVTATVKTTGIQWAGLGVGSVVPTNISAGALQSLGLGTIGAGNFQFMTTNANFEAAAFFQNGNTSGFTNPGDNDALHWFDEDSPATAAWKITTTGAIVTVSDKDLKEDIKTIDHKNTYEKFKKFNFVSFKWRLDAKNKRLKKLLEIAKVKKDVKKIKFYEECVEYHSRNDYGIIAQEFLKDVGLPGIVEKSTGCDFRANYQHLFVYACSVIQELQSLVEEKASSIPVTVSEAKVKEYKNGEIVNIREFNSGTKEALGYFQVTVFTVKPPWYTKDIPDLIYKTNDTEKEIYLLNMQFTTAFSLTFDSEDAINSVKSLLNNSSALLFNSKNKKAAMIIDNKIKYLKFEE